MRIPGNIINKSKIESKKNILPYISASSSVSFLQLNPKNSNKKPELKVKPFLRLKSKISSQQDIFGNTSFKLKKEKLYDIK